MDTKKLRQKILDLAIRGKLVQQDPNDEPASVLLERIRAEKERLIKEGKIKKSKASKTSDTPHYEQVPFEVPSSWIVCPLETLATFGGGKTPSMDNKEYWNNGKHLWVTSKDMKSVHIVDSLMKISDSALEQMTIYPKGTLLLVTRSGILRHTLPIAILEKEATINQDIKTISCYYPHLQTFIYYAIKAQEQIILKEYHKDGTTVDSIDFDKFKKLPIPLPPLKEQIRIIAEIAKWFSLIDTIENNKNDLQETIQQAKSKILDLAIHGKLVPQDPNDEPASELLKRINPRAEITCDNGHYENLPDGWTLIKVGDAAVYTNGRAFKPEEWMEEGLPIIRIQNLNDKTAAYNFSTQSFESKYLIEKGDLLFAWAASLGTYIWEGEDAWLNQHIFKVEPYPFVRKEYLHYVFKAMISEFYSQSHGSGMVHITKKQFESVLLMLPPYTEQKRIVNKIEELFAKLDTIMESL